MKCPKCGFEGESSVECDRCGVVFEKLRNRRPPPPPPQEKEAPAARDEGGLSSLAVLLAWPVMVIEQHARHWWEILLNWEQANQYHICNNEGRNLGLMEEHSTGFLNALMRVFLGSHRPLDITVNLYQRDEVVLELRRSFFFFFSDLDVITAEGRRLGSVHRRFGIIYKRYDLLDESGRVFARIASPLWRLWTFPIFNMDGEKVAVISKKWSGLAKEYFTDADNFALDFGEVDWNLPQKAVIFAAALSIDFDFFENNNNR